MSKLETHTTDRLGLLVIDPAVFGDARGFFKETWNAVRYAGLGLPSDWVQDNVSLSGRGVLRGLHFQNPHGQAKLVWAARGEVFDVAVDVRVGSPTFGQWVGLVLSAQNHHQLYVPPGFAHGFCVTSEYAQSCAPRSRAIPASTPARFCRGRPWVSSISSRKAWCGRCGPSAR
jgi:dTDP-4-dehydrorhamnose 3,5-epimerase